MIIPYQLWVNKNSPESKSIHPFQWFSVHVQAHFWENSFPSEDYCICFFHWKFESPIYPLFSFINHFLYLSINMQNRFSTMPHHLQILTGLYLVGFVKKRHWALLRKLVGLLHPLVGSIGIGTQGLLLFWYVYFYFRVTCLASSPCLSNVKKKN